MKPSPTRSLETEISGSEFGELSRRADRLRNVLTCSRWMPPFPPAMSGSVGTVVAIDRLLREHLRP